MNYLKFLICILFVFLNACGLLDPQDQSTVSDRTNTNSTNRGTGPNNPNKGTGSSNQNKGSVPLPPDQSLVEFEQGLKDRLDSFKRSDQPNIPGALPSQNSIEPKVLHKLVRVVKAQTGTWCCGNVQCYYAKTATCKVGEKESFNPNVVGDYPLLINLEIPSAAGPLVNQFGLQLEKENGKSYFRVGAMPNQLPDYLNQKLGVSDAALVASEDLTRDELLDLVNKSVSQNKPVIALYVIDSDKFLLHYFGIVGFNINDNSLLLLDTTGEGPGRFKTHDIDDFLDNMNTSDFRQKLKNKLNALNSAKFLLGNLINLSSLPDESILDNLQNYNIITF